MLHSTTKRALCYKTDVSTQLRAIIFTLPTSRCPAPIIPPISPLKAQCERQVETRLLIIVHYLIAAADFWDMCIQQKAAVIVMWVDWSMRIRFDYSFFRLCDFNELGVEKCYQYLPITKHDAKEIGDYQIRCIDSVETQIDTAILTQLEVTMLGGIESSRRQASECVDYQDRCNQALIDCRREKTIIWHLRWCNWADHTSPSSKLIVCWL